MDEKLKYVFSIQCVRWQCFSKRQQQEMTKFKSQSRRYRKEESDIAAAVLPSITFALASIFALS
jgi:hypothetical protein